MTWAMVPHFLLRGTGFPFVLLDALAFAETTAEVDALIDAEHDLAALGDRLREMVAADHDEATAAHRRRWWRCLRDGKRIGPAPDGTSGEIAAALSRWDRAVAELAEQRALVDKVFATELAERRGALREIVDDGRFREAVWLSSPPMLARGIDAYRSGRGGASAVRRVERQLVAYLQRFCAKNDTAGFFGPIGYGVLGDRLPGLPAEGGAPGETGRREAFVASWAVLALAEAIAADPAVRPHLVPRRSPLFRVHTDAGWVELPGRGGGTVSGRRRDVLALVDGTRDVTAIAELLGITAADALDVLDLLVEKGIVRLVPEPPVTVPQPITWLCEWVAALPERTWPQRLAPFVSVPAVFADLDLAGKQAALADLEQRFSEITGADARRGSGGFYVDRLLVYEEAVTAAPPLRLPDDVGASILQRLAPVLDLYAASAVHAQQRLREHGARRLRELAPDGRVPLLSWIAAAPSTLDDEADPWRAAVLEQLAGREHVRVADIDVAALPPGPDLAGEVLISSPDLFLLAEDAEAVRRGRFDLVVGEVHDSALVWGWPLRFHPYADEVTAATAEAIRSARGSRTVASVLPGKRVKITPYEYPGPTVELSAPSVKDPADRVPAAEVTTLITDRGPVLHADALGEFTLHNGELHTVAHRVFGLPRVVPPNGWTTGAHTPRLRIGGVVVQRERWQVRRGELFPGTYAGDEPALLADFRRAARRLGLPRYVYARAIGDRKPVFVDGRSWMLLQVLHHLFDGDREVVLTEMLPAPDQLWARGPGGRYCAELRFTVYREQP